MTWKNASASQITAYLRCPSRWYINKIVGIPQPETPALALGKAKHAELERYELTGDESHLSPMTKPVVSSGLLPGLPVSEEHVERRVDLLCPGTVPIIGYVDLESPESRTITDHKTASRKSSIKTPEELAQNPQAIIYCYDALERWGGDEPITFRHIYYMTKGNPRVFSTSVELAPEHIRTQFEQLVSIVSEMQETSTQQENDVAFNSDACGDYGGCPYRDRCIYSGKLDAFRSLPDGDPVNFFKTLKSKSPEPVHVLPVTVNPPDGEVFVAPPAEKIPAEKIPAEKIPAEKIPAEKIPAEKIPSEKIPAEKIPAEKTLAETPAEKATKTRGLRHNDQLVSTMSKRDLQSAWLELHRQSPNIRCNWDGESRATRKIIMEDVVSFLTSEPVSDESETVSPVSVVSDDVTYTDPSIAKIESLEERNAILMTELSELEVFVQQIDELQKDLNATQEKLRGLETENYQLYIGCHPHRLSVIYADELFHVLQVKVAEIANVPHYALLEYGEGPKRVASLLRQQLASGALKLPLRLVIDRRNPCADACLDVLIPLYRNCGGQIIERMG